MKRAYDLLELIKKAYQTILGDTLTGIYLHGSLAFGCFRWECSDIDFLVVVETEPTLKQKEALIQTLLDLNPHAPAKGFEMSVVLKEDCKHFRYPLPYCLHYSNAHLKKAEKDLTAYCIGMQGLDPDLAAHITVTRATGQVLYGPAIDEVFAPVPASDYLNSIWCDIENAEEDIFENPVYVILNLCRVLAFVQDGLVLSKEQGGTWGQTHLPENLKSVVRRAQKKYVYGTAYTFNAAELVAFAQELLQKIQKKRY